MENKKKVFKRVAWLVGLHLVLFALIYEGANRYYEYTYVGKVFRATPVPGFYSGAKKVWNPPTTTCLLLLKNGDVVRYDGDCRVGQTIVYDYYGQWR